MAPSAISPFSLDLLSSSSSPSLQFLTLDSKTHTLRTLKLKLSCSHQTIQESNSTKKKRKPRPSFLDQVQDKWSLKPTSLREKFPWQQQQKQEQEPIEEKEHEKQQQKSRHFSGIVSDPVSFDSRNRANLAPWAKKNKPNKPQFDSQSEKGKRVDEFRGHGEKNVSSSLETEVSYDGKFEDGIVETVETPIGFAEKGEIFPIKADKSSSLGISEKRKNVDTFRGHHDRNVSSGLETEVSYDGKIKDGIVETVETPIGFAKKGGIFPIKADKSLSLKRSEKGKSVDTFRGHHDRNVSSSFVQEMKNLEREMHYDGKFEIDDSPIGFAEKEEILPINGGFGDKCDSMRLPYEIKSDLLRERLPWEKESEIKSVNGEKLRENNTIMAEKLIPEPELKRLRNVSLRMLERVKVGAVGITQSLVDSIHEKWKEDEVVKLKFEGPSAMNMKRTHEIIESRTGGLVIWRSGTSIVLFRGMSYKLPCVQSYAKSQSSENSVNDFTQMVGQNVSTSTHLGRYMKDLSKKELMDLSELNLLLDELGPRFKDWSGRDPLPVDADLLPPVVRGYKRPFRLLPYGTRQALRDKDMTFYRRTARTMPPHFALGRNRELQGLARAMVKLWGRSAIAKIAIKRGVHNTCNERMAEELKRLTGGTLVSRNKDFIVFYRGNDFMPPGVTYKLEEAQKLAALRQDEEDRARHVASTLIDSNEKAAIGPLVAGTLAETMAATSRWRNQTSNEERERMMRDLALARHASLVRFLEKKLSLAYGKVKKAEMALQKVQEYLEPSELPTDLETLTDEERFLFRKIGLSMKPYLVLGRRGIFDGTVENMHLHWKYRELVKIIVSGKRFAQVKHIAISLEAESGGVLVSVDNTTKGYAIIVYRGKNYQRPYTFRPTNLLTRRQALARSIELQRREALKHHISELQGRIDKLKSELEDMETVKEIDEETLYSRVDNASDNDDDDDDDNGNGDMEEDEDEAYLEIYDGGDDEDVNT